MIAIKEQMERIYRDLALNDIPWNAEAAPELLTNAVTTRTPRPRTVIDLGCGAGNYVIALARMGFEVAGVDIAEPAIEFARQSALRAGVTCRWVAADVLGEPPAIMDRYDFAYDWELLHHIFPEDRDRYLRTVYGLLNPSGTYLSVCFSEDDPQFGGVGKYRRTSLGTLLYHSSEEEIRALVAKRFVIDELKTIELRGKRGSHKAIYVLARKEL
jgi:methyl halide transferase